MRRLLVMAILVGELPLFSQTPTGPRSSFDVSVIKPSTPGTRDALAIQPGGRFVSNGFSLQALIGLAWHLKGFELSGGDSWTANDRWSIEAKTEEGLVVPAWTPPNIPEEIAIRLRSLLEDRFLLKTHRETRNLPVYRLTVSKNGEKLTDVDPPEAVPGPQNSSMRAGPGAVIGSSVPMIQIVTVLSRLMDRPLIDKTGLTGFYSFNLRFAAESAPRALSGASATSTPPTDDPSLFTALQDQLGLKLESAQEPVEVLVIDSARKPTEN